MVYMLRGGIRPGTENLPSPSTTESASPPLSAAAGSKRSGPPQDAKASNKRAKTAERKEVCLGGVVFGCGDGAVGLGLVRESANIDLFIHLVVR
jgi:hypothetical protein